MPFLADSRTRILPAGTLLTVQLEEALSTNKARAGDEFTASVAAPLTLDGDTLIERGTTVIGRVESAQAQTDRPGLAPAAGYFRLTLSAISLEDKRLVLQTSSLFTRVSPQRSNISPRAGHADLRSDGVRIPKGRRLTFRLTAPVTINYPNSVADRQSTSPISE